MPSTAWVVVDEFFEVESGTRYRRGTILSPGVELERLRSLGLLALPTDSEMAESAISGAHRWDWGGGWTWNGIASFGCPMVLHTPVGEAWVYWLAELKQVGVPAGYLRLVSQVGRGDGTLSVGLRPDGQPPDLVTLRDRSPILVSGRARLSAAIGGFVSLALQGTATGVLVSWSAVSRCSEHV